MRNKIKLMIVLFFLCLLMSGCSCEHTWTAASCIEPKTCSDCGATEGSPLGHDWSDATCIVPKTCAVCNAVEGTVANHHWTAATCTAPKTCSVCGEFEGEADGHKWEDATCTKPMVCSKCAEIAGEALGHDWQDATCTTPSTCRICGVTSGEAAGHIVDTWKISKKSTCTEAGTETGVCNTCGETVERSLNLAEHTPGDWNVTVEPTENSEGTRVKYCTACNKELENEKFTLTTEEIATRYKNRCQRIAYDDLARTPDKYEGELVKFSGYVVQVCSEASSPFYYSTYRVATSGRYNNVVFIYVDNYGSGERILEDDYITFYGVYDGLYTYTTVMGASITIPSIKVAYVD